MFRVVLLGLVGVLAATGCGTMRNMDGRTTYNGPKTEWTPPTPFGGVANDARWLSETVCDVEEVLDVPGAVIGCAFILVDMPLSIVGDVVTLPQTMSPPPQPSGPPGGQAPPHSSETGGLTPRRSP